MTPLASDQSRLAPPAPAWRGLAATPDAILDVAATRAALDAAAPPGPPRRRPQGGGRGAARAPTPTAARRSPPAIAAAPREAHRAIHDYAWLIDRIVTLTLDLAAQRLHPLANPTASERIGALAVGGYGRAEMAPFSDVDLLFVTPYKQTALGREPDRERALLPLGPAAEGRPRGAHRRRLPALRQGRPDDPHQPARAPLPLGRPGAGDAARRPALERALRRHRAAVRRAEARRARGAARAAGQLALPARAERQGGQGRPARPADALLDRQVPEPRQVARGPDRDGGLHPRGVPHLHRGRGLPLDHPRAPAPAERTRQRAADLRHPGRDRRDARLPQHAGAARRRAVHAGLFHPRQERRRPDPHLPRRRSRRATSSRSRASDRSCAACSRAARTRPGRPTG